MKTPQIVSYRFVGGNIEYTHNPTHHGSGVYAFWDTFLTGIEEQPRIDPFYAFIDAAHVETELKFYMKSKLPINGDLAIRFDD